MAQDDLRRELGFWDALTIGAGTMIGAGIFLLAGVALELTGPAAIFSYVAAGIVCMITAASAAELATDMPTSGGDYVFVSRSLRPAITETVANPLGSVENIRYFVQKADSVTEGIEAEMATTGYDFVIIGASREWTLRQVLFGSIPDVVADRADCSVLMARRYVPNTLSVRAVEGVKRLKESVGLTTSPEE